MHWAASRNAQPLPGLGCKMLSKIVALFLVGMAVLAMFGKLRFPGQKALRARRCTACGRLKLGKAPCPCQKGSS